jgi:sec-independent protein translocase protein TatC
MSIVGAVRLFSTRPASPVGEGGRMALVDHFRELRARLLQSLVVFVVLTGVAFFFYDQILNLITHPYNNAVDMLGGRTSVNSSIVLSGITAGLMLQLKLCALAGAVMSSPFWLYQIWAFIVPGLHRHERRYTRIFIAIAGPLFFAGVAVGYYVLPKGLQLLISLNSPKNFQNLIDFKDFFSFTVRMLLVFGISFEIPFFVVLLNLAGIVPAAALSRHRPWIIVGTFLFAAVATPSTDPISMLLLAVPMTLLFLISEGVAHLTDRRRRRRSATEQVADDEVSPL